MVSTTRAFHRLQRLPAALLDQQIRSGERADDLQALFGPALAAEMQQMTSSVSATLGGERPHVMLLPGIMGTTLFNTGFSPGLVWLNVLGALGGRLDMLELKDDGKPAIPRLAIEPRDLIATTYLPIRLHLQYLRGCDVTPFPFDWRFSPRTSAEALRKTVQALRASDERKIHLVGHSMGGLVAQAYCLLYPDEAYKSIAQVITLGTPYLGSYEAIRTLVDGGDTVRLVQHVTGSRSIYDVVRSLPALYSMLPAPPSQSQTFATQVGFDWYSNQAYQIDTIRARHLETAQKDYEDFANKPLPVPVTAIIGRGVATCTRVNKTPAATSEVHFTFDREDDSGDGTVPFFSARAIPEARFVPVNAGKHGDLPLYGDVRRAVASLVHGNIDQLPTELETGLLSAEATLQADEQVPETPIHESDIGQQGRAERIRHGKARPEDIAALTRAAI